MTNTLLHVSRRFIRFLLFAAVVAVLGHGGASGQINTITGYNQVLGQWDASHAARTNNSRTGTGSPVGRDDCLRVGESYFQTDATPGENNWSCVTVGTPGSWMNSGGTVTSVSASCLTWITCPVATATTTPALTIGAASGQTPHQVIGTCGTATSFGPCSLEIADLPGTLVTSASSLVSTALMTGAGSQASQTTSTKLSGGVFFPSADSTTAIQFDKANGTSNVLTVDTTDGYVGIGTATPSNALHVVGTARIAAAASSQNGTAGTATCVQPVTGGVKISTCYLNGYANTGTAQTYSYPTAFSTTPVLLESGGSCGAYNSSTTASTLTLPANASMTAETCNIVAIGQ